MRKVYISIILFFMLFIPNLVKAEDTINIGIAGNYGPSQGPYVNQTGNLEPYMAVQSGDVFTNMAVYGTNVSNTYHDGDRFLVKSNWCVWNNPENISNWSLSFKNAARITINDYSIKFQPGTCAITRTNGTVEIGTGTLYIDIDFSFISSSSGTTWQGNFALKNSGAQGLNAGFVNYDIYNQEQINNNQNTDRIIDNSDQNTDRLIQNDNANTDRIINNANANSQAEIDATDRNTQAVNGLNDSVNNTDTTGSENVLSSIINDPAFQDNTGINSIITLPLAMISSLSNTCQPINVNIPFINTNTSLPCFRSIINQHMPLLANMITIVINGFILYRVFIDIVGIIKSARNPDEDRLDVLEL